MKHFLRLLCASASLKVLIFWGGTAFSVSSLHAAPCYPSDPTGNNPGNLCPVFPPPGVNPDTFVQGTGRSIRELPTTGNPGGRVLFTPNGVYTGIQTNGGLRTITTSTGQSIQLPSQ